MGIELAALLTLIVFVVLLLNGRGQVARGSNAQLANGAVLLTLAMIVGLLALGMVSSLDFW